ncbi:MAG TPA: insulinase family protein [Pyrinomonadaceae bacterium]|jgi:zinc protease|nr:insulinase family protein [Pyrinomonadaceae bacterium]
MPKKMMNYLPRLFSAALCLSLVAILTASVRGQTPEPERETLLNGLRILYWSQPGNPEVLVRLRIHSGAAFDLADKGGMMALLGDALFPDATIREYVAEELGGKLTVTTNYDSLDATISGKAANLERMIDLLRGAVTTTQLGAENIAALKDARIKSYGEQSGSASDVADRAITARLFGSFPYAHPAGGTVLSLSKIERGDLMLARERFLNSDNATVAVVGGVEKPRLMRALRQLLGPWGKSDKTIPATFRQPSAPNPQVLIVDAPESSTAEIRLAVRGLARADVDALSAELLALIARGRWQVAVPELSHVSVRHEAHLLPGVFVFSATVPQASASKAVAAAQDVMRKLSQAAPSADELERARTTLSAQWSQQLSQPAGLAEAWLDMDTFKSPRPNTVSTLITSSTPADVQRVATRLFKDAPAATIVVGNSEQLKAQFPGNVETKANTATPPAKP